ncbi:hypothetical protein BBP00_00008904 [Phytophthora kernoviae]|uniref:PX domain-containing protein n=1 Tax=Phytophthora kernoviae TaxID=325452 RepID=A0A3F2RE42_9STRA|nr:hypothetical protein BBP00_00008904 [Phytophthora kernoviae]
MILEETRADLQSRNSAFSHASSSEDSDEVDELPQRYSMGTQSLSRLSRLSTIAKFAMKLNQIHHIRICSTYDDGSGAIVYVLNVYLRYVQKGLPPVMPRRESERQRKKRLQLQKDTERPMYQVEHRYSAFRELKRHIVKTVNARGEHRHLMQCAYCSRVKFIDSSATFPPRVLSRVELPSLANSVHALLFYRRFDQCKIDTTTDTDTERSSLDTDLNCRLSQLSRAKIAVALNQVHHVRMSTAYDRKEHVTVYVLDVFLQSAPRGIPKPVKESKSERKKRELREKDELRPDYQVEYRYSTFRALRQRVGEAVKALQDRSHSQWCPYCTRVRDLVSSGLFPSRFPNGRVALVTGLHSLLVRSRQERLEIFVNQLLSSAKDISYRSGCTPCVRFEIVSKLLSEFLTEAHLRTPGSACGADATDPNSPDPAQVIRMPLESLAQLLSFASFRRHRGRLQRRQRLLKNRSRVHTVNMRGGVVHVPAVENMAIEFDTLSQSPLLTTCYSSVRTDWDTIEFCKDFRPAVDPVELAKRDQNKLQKALDRATQQERKKTRKMQKLANKAARQRGSSGSNRIALLSAGACSIASDEDILAEIWASRSPSCDGIADDDLPEVDEDFSQSAPMEFMFFMGCPDDRNLRELDVGYRRHRSNTRAARCPSTSSYATTIPIKPTLVSKMPPLFVPRLGNNSGCDDNVA